MQAIKNIYFALLENIDYYGILGLMFLAIFTMILAIAFIIRGRQTSTNERLGKFVSKGGEVNSGDNPPSFLFKKQETLATKISKPLHKISSIEKRSVRHNMQLKLIRAGYRSDQAIYNFLAAKVVCPLIYVVIFMVTQMLYKFQTKAFIYIVLLIILGFFTPNLWVFLLTKTRQEKIVKGLPDALDLMVVCVESGLGIDMTFKRVGDEMLPICKDLSEEFTLTTLEVRAGVSRDDAYKNMNLRMGVSEMNSLTSVLAQTSRFGTNLATALRVHSDSMRTRRRQFAEAVASKAVVKMVFPLILFIFPAIFVVLIGPGALKIIKHLLPAFAGSG
jgi:tight adherence protein C